MDKLGINLLDHHENAALIVRNSDKNVKILYRDLLKQVLKISLFIEQEDIPKYSTIGIYGDKSYALVTITLGIIETDYSFCYITKDNFDDMNFEYFFSLSQLLHLNNIELKKTLTLCDSNIYFYKLNSAKEIKIFNDAANNMNKICYTIGTSGTTGRRKIIHVTYNSIYPNIKSLQKIFTLDSSDVIFSVSPITFDVFIVDLFLALHSGASLLFINDVLRFDTNLYSKDSDKPVTFLQITPTIFKQYGLENIRNKILHTDSSLKYLVLGGEEFPAKDVINWQNWEDKDNCKRIFNIYGITEMSCWALIHEVTNEDLKFGKIPLGEPLDNDTLPAYYPHTEDIEELILTTPSRVNFFDGKDWDKKLGTNGVFAYITNDLIRKINGKTYWYGRLNDIVKKFGERVDLKNIEDVASEIVQPVSCIMIRKRIALFYQADHDNFSQLLSNHLRLKLKKAEFPDDIKRIDFLPTCDHGKVSKKKLKELYKDILKEDNTKQSAEEIFLDAINQMFNLKLEKPTERTGDEPDGKRTKHNIDSTFTQIGGNSFAALSIVMKIEDKMSSMSNALLPKLLDNQNTIKDIFAYLKNLNLKVKNGNTSKSFSMINLNRSIDFKVCKKFNLQKCVDSTPTTISINDKNFIVVGGHSGKLIAINEQDISVASVVQLDDRIENEATQLKGSIIIGCYDGFLYCIDFLDNDENKRIKWKYNSGAMIKSKPLVVNNEFIVFGNYNYEQNLRCLRVNETADSVDLLWSKLLGTSGILANILQLDADSIIVCTLDGVVERTKLNNGNSIWQKKFEYPIFSSPQKLDKFKAIVCAEVMRKVHCIDYDGNVLWKFETHGHIFSSFLFVNSLDSVKIIFGCHDNKLRCLNYESEEISLEWETELQSQIYGSPKTINFASKDFLISCSTNGYVNLINISSGKVESSIKLPGEIFSSALVVRDKIFIGCRDNYVYCLSLKHD